jgi:hypothetical protein
MKRRTMHYYLFSVLSYFVLSISILFGCNQNNSININIAEKPTWEKMLLNSPTCVSSCWENINPGVTTIFEAESILNNIVNVSVDGHPQNVTPLDVYDFYWSFNDGGSGRILSKPGSEIINEITLFPITNSVTVADLITIYGQPAYINIYQIGNGITLQKDTCNVYLAFPDKGIFVNIWTIQSNYNPIKVKISDSTFVESMYIIEAGTESYKSYLLNFYNVDGLDILKTFQNWNGYAEYQYIEW